MLSRFRLSLPLGLAVVGFSANRLASNEIPSGALEVLQDGATLDLFSIRPEPTERTDDKHFQGYPILRTKTIRSEEKRRELIRAFRRGVTENKGMNDWIVF
jgi:hypothetical protein